MSISSAGPCDLSFRGVAMMRGVTVECRDVGSQTTREGVWVVYDQSSLEMSTAMDLG